MKKICKIFAAALFAGLSFVSCKNNFSLVQLEEKEKAYLSFAINEGDERKVAPVELTWKEVDSIELTKNGEILQTWKTSGGNSAYDQMKADNSITLEYGKYNFTITLKDKKGNLLQNGKLNDFEIKAGENLLNFETRACLKGKEKLTINCSYKDYKNTIRKVYYSITTVNGDNVKNDEVDYEHVKTTTYTLDDLNCGEYIVSVKIVLGEDLILNSKDDFICKSELVENQNKRETIFNCIASEETKYAPVEYLFRNEEPVEFTKDVSSYELGGTLPSVDIIKNKPEGAKFLGWFDVDDNKITKLPETSTEKVIVYAVFEKTVRSADDIIDDGTSYTIILTDDNFKAINEKIHDTCINCLLLDFSNITTDISEYGFGKVRVTEVILPKNLKTLGEYVFYNNHYLKTVTFPEDSQLESIGTLAFANCSSLTKVVIPKSVKSIGKKAFFSSLKLKSVEFEKDSLLTTIGASAFAYCSSLTGITISEKVTTIGDLAFSWCKGLQEIEIPASVETIGKGAFYACSILTKVTFMEGTKIISIGDNAFKSCGHLTTITIPETVTSIGNYFFSGCYSLTSITIPETVESIGDNAFDSCTSLSTVTFSGTSKLKTIGQYAFTGCSSLSEITIPNGVTLGHNAFFNTNTKINY